MAREHVWRSEKTVKPPVNNDPIPPVDPDDIPPAGGDGIPEDPAGPTSPTEPALVEIPEQEVPLAAPPRTGDPNGKWMTMFYLSGISLAAFLLVIRMKTCI